MCLHPFHEGLRIASSCRSQRRIDPLGKELFVRRQILVPHTWVNYVLRKKSGIRSVDKPLRDLRRVVQMVE